MIRRQPPGNRQLTDPAHAGERGDPHSATPPPIAEGHSLAPAVVRVATYMSGFDFR